MAELKQIEPLDLGGYIKFSVERNGEVNWIASVRYNFIKSDEARALHEWLGRALGLGWQPIETAPKDGVLLLISRRAGRDYHHIGEFWSHENGWRTVSGIPILFPAFWMPLPAPPAEVNQ